MNYILVQTVHTVTELFEIRDNILEEIVIRDVHRGVYTAQLLERLHKSQDNIMKENLRMAIDKTIWHAFVLKTKGVTCNGRVYTLTVEDLYVRFEKDGENHEITISGLQNFTAANVSGYTDNINIIDQITKYVEESKDQDFSHVLNKAYNSGLGDFRTARKRENYNGDLLKTTSARGR